MSANIDVSKFIYHQDAGDPKPQNYYSFKSNSWTEKSPGSSSDNLNAIEAVSQPCTTIRLISWNIDMLIPWAEPRMAAALQHLSTLVSSAPPNQAIVIFLQEMGPSDLAQIQAATWVRQRFHITDTSGAHWGNAQYGTTTLVDRRLRIAAVFRVPFESMFQRDGFFVDVRVAGEPRVLRLANVHLESLVADPPLRPAQMETTARYLHDEVVYAALLAGDCNSIQPFDRTIHSDNGLEDAYLVLGGKEDSDEGYTWGPQVPEAMFKKFGPSRMDRVMFCGKVKAKSLQRIGVGVKVDDDQLRKEMIAAGQVDFVTDHYGVMAEMELDGSNLDLSEGNSSPQKS